MAATFCEEVAPLPTDGLPAPADDDEAVLSAGMANDWCMVGEEMGWKNEKKPLKPNFISMICDWCTNWQKLLLWPFTDIF